MDCNVFQKMAMLNGEERKSRPQGWTIVNVIKRLFAIIIIISILKMVLFPSNDNPSEAKMFKEAQK